MTVTITEHRFAVEHRKPGSKKWQTIVTCGSAAIASRTMYDLMSTRVGDWAVRPVAAPCVDTDRAGASDSGIEPRGR